MSAWSRLQSLWRGLFARRAFEQRMQEEFDAHIAMRAQDLRGAGLSPQGALRQARLEFGGVETHKEEVRSARGLRWFDETRGDVSYAARLLRRGPGFALVTVLTLGFGIGATAAMFSALDAVLLRPLPFTRPERLVELERVIVPTESSRRRAKGSVEIDDVRALTGVFTHAAAYAPGSVNLTGDAAPRRVQIGVVTHDWFTTLGVAPVVGRVFGAVEEDPGSARVAIISHGMWQTRFGESRLPGKTIDLNGRSYAVVGVMPRGFAFPEAAEIWIPFRLPIGSEGWEPFRQYIPSRTVARLSSGVTMQRAGVVLRSVHEPYARAGQAPPELHELIAPLRDQLLGGPEAARQQRTMFLVLLGAAGLVLMIACANVANLLLARGVVRRREIALRNVLGATPSRVMRQLLVETGVLALAGAALGLALAAAGMRLLDVLVPEALVGAVPLRLDARVLGFSLALAALTGLAFGLMPALTARRANVSDLLKTGSAGAVGTSAHLRRAFVLAQVTLAVVLLIGSGLMLRSLHALMTTDSGVNAERVATLELTLARVDYPSIDARRRFYQAVLERLQALPQVDAAAAVNELPLRGVGSVRFLVYPEGQAPQAMDMKYMAQDMRITPDYFDALGIAVQAGRPPQPRADTLQPAEVAISRSLANAYWSSPNEALGRRLQMPGDRKLLVVGVVADVRPKALDAETVPQMYQSLLEVPYDNGAVVARGRAAAETLIGAVRQAVHDVAPNQAVYNVRTMENVIAGAVAQRRTNTLLLSAFGILALALASIGVYGVVAYSVAARSRELGIRIALGAEPARVLRAVVGDGLVLIATGSALGLVAAWLLSRVVTSLIYGIEAQDWVTFVVAPLVLILAGLLAALVPARRTLRLEPLSAMKAD